MRKIEVKTYQRKLLRQNLQNIFGDFEDTLLTQIEPHLQWYEIEGGEILFKQNEQADYLFFVISGRLKATVINADGISINVGEIIRGETVGEMAIFTGEPRSATVTALRDSVLVQLTKQLFTEIITHYPQVAVNVTKLIIHRLQKTQQLHNYKKPVNICLLPLHNSIDAAGFAKNFNNTLQKIGNSFLADSYTESTLKNQFTQATHDDDFAELLSGWFDEKEADNEFLLLLAQPAITPWTLRCIRQADIVMLLADATINPQLTEIDSIRQKNMLGSGAAYTLLMLHPTETKIPAGTAQWLQQRPWVSKHYHIQANNQNSINRLARITAGIANGLVFAGGGSKGFAHIGVLKALEEANIPIDYVGGTSVGSMVAASVAFNQGAAAVQKFMREGAMYNPTKDINFFPIVSIIQGKRIEQMVSDTVYRFTGLKDINIEDTWLPFFAVSTNYTQAKEEVHTKGSLTKYVVASTAIPGVFPPVVDGNNLLIDGGTFNNLPADVMVGMGCSTVIGSEFGTDKEHTLNVSKMPTSWELFKAKYIPFNKKKYRLPGLFSILLNAPLLYSNARRNQTKQMIDLYFNPDVNKYGIMNWKAYDAIVAKGYEHAKEVLSKLNETDVKHFKKEL